MKMNPTVMLALQALLAGAQLVNAQIATVTKSPLITLAIGAVVLVLQVFVQGLGNSLTPTAAKQLIASQASQIATSQASDTPSAPAPPPAPVAAVKPPPAKW